ncbi:GNAT family N-acetyltransferase [uncultured Agrococcus sp.]|uniref:GNAT family N-acetyltransferase n=1 Tax=uncultured Agrococcus sp. TaxID=382258 RepID=UPI0025D42AE4|nr:GNAT family N-acetyltransferase [uncultured Agrococcus sp.]
MERPVTVRDALPEDAADMARVHVESWRATYRGIISDEVLDAPDFVSRRATFWRTVLEDPRFASYNAAVAVVEGRIVGIALVGGAADDEAESRLQLFVLYVDVDFHGTGTGSDLLAAVLPAAATAVLWVADPNPRAQAFYRKQGFRATGEAKDDDGVREIRMVRE